MQARLCLSVWGASWGCGREGQRAGAPPIPPTCIADDTHKLKQWLLSCECERGISFDPDFIV